MSERKQLFSLLWIVSNSYNWGLPRRYCL